MDNRITDFSVKATSLSCMLNRNSNIELLPEPFRLQGHVAFHVAYSEYVNYIRSLDVDSPIQLSAPIARLKTLVSSQSSQLYLHYLQDMAFAIMKEVWFAEQYKTDGTIILPESDGVVTKLSAFLNSYKYGCIKEAEFLSQVGNVGFRPNSVRRPHNVNLQKLAVCLYYLSQFPTGVSEISLVYDIS